MTFVSSTFVIFIVAFAVLWRFTPGPWRWLTLLIASYCFYIWHEPIYGVLLLSSTSVDYFCAIQMAKRAEKKKRRPFLLLSIFTNVGLLAGFKYADFLTSVFTGADIMSFEPFKSDDLLIPIGISFYTFQTLSYTIDVYRGQTHPEHHFGKFAVFVSFFPQLIAGPIERFRDLMPQIHRLPKGARTEQIETGVRLIIWGVFKKVVVADRVGVIVDHIFDAPGSYSGVTLLAGGTLFLIQAYADFSGYTDIARGMASCMGIRLSINWRYPLFSTSMQSFWRDWHVTLGRWFRDYVYIPLGGNRHGFSREIGAILIVVILSGLWHGANLTFIIWGLSNGVYLIMERLWRKAKLPKLPGPAAWAWLLIINSLIFICFRAPTTEGLLFYIESMAANITSFDLKGDFIQMGIWHISILATFLAVVFMLIREYLAYRSDIEIPVKPLRWMWAGIAAITLFVGEFTDQLFIYFMF